MPIARVPAERQAGGALHRDAAGRRAGRGAADERRSEAPVAVDERVAIAAAIAEEVAVHLAVEPGADAAQQPVPLARDRVAADAAVHAD